MDKLEYQNKGCYLKNRVSRGQTVLLDKNYCYVRDGWEEVSSLRNINLLLVMLIRFKMSE